MVAFFSSMDVAWVRVLKNRGRGLGSVSHTIVSLLSLFFCISGLRFFPNDTLRAEGFRLPYSIEEIHYRNFSHISSRLYLRDYHAATAIYQILVEGYFLL